MSTFAFMMETEPDGNMLPAIKLIVDARLNELESLLSRVHSSTEVYHLASTEHDALQSIENILSDTLA